MPVIAQLVNLAEDLERWLHGHSIVARPVSPPVRLWRWSRRNPIVAGMAALLLALAIAVGVLIWKNGVTAKRWTASWYCNCAL